MILYGRSQPAPTRNTAMFNFFRRLQWKLTLFYAVVTAGTVIVLTMLLIGIAVYFETQNNLRTFESYFWSKTGLQDNKHYLPDDRPSLPMLKRVHCTSFVYISAF